MFPLQSMSLSTLTAPAEMESPVEELVETDESQEAPRPNLDLVDEIVASWTVRNARFRADQLLRKKS